MMSAEHTALVARLYHIEARISLNILLDNEHGETILEAAKLLEQSKVSKSNTLGSHIEQLLGELDGHAFPVGGAYINLCERAAAAIRALAGELDDEREMRKDSTEALCVEVDETERLRAEVERLNEKLPCGHRKVDMSDSYGGCVLCQYKDGYHEYEEAVEALRAEVAALSADLENVQTENDQRAIEVAALRKDAERYRWLANRVLACDYGDNDATGEQIGWRIRHDLLAKGNERQPAFMYGTSIDKAIDAASLDKPLSGPTP